MTFPLSSKSISVFLPFFNERENIRDVVQEAHNYLRERFGDYEILLVTSEQSTDGTNFVAAELEREIPKTRVVRRGREEKFAYAGALRTGFRNSKKELIFFTDGDHQFDIRDLDLLLPFIETYDIVTGYRITRNDPLMRRWMSNLYGWTARFLFGLALRDINCAFKLYKRKVIDAVDFLPDISEGVVNIEIYLTGREKGYSIKEVGVRHFPRTKGSTEAEIGRFGNIVALVKPRIIFGFLRDTYKVWKKFRRSRGLPPAQL